ncbi:PE-PPE domain-containing protein [Mycolicibacterium sp. CH28]|uniref:PE-PPE domain-containing protein n=1 Tax=Mycolicibacterium sp. CH28 TaxID=2512237 RepID=UPI0013876437|nr:PE-PPE domain-containing protein [Mycolicibacterium sp. CH28]
MAERVAHRAAAVLAGVALTAAVTAAVAAPDRRVPTVAAPVTLSATVLVMGGLGYEDLDPELIKGLLGGRYTNETCANDPCLRGLSWPGSLAPSLNQSVEVGIVNMDTAIRNTPGPKIVIGASGSTLVVDEEMRALANDPTAPPKEELSFVVLGDANRGIFKQLQGMKLPLFEYTVPEIPVTKYDIVVVAGEYDGLGDWPDRSWNLLADFNALAGTSLFQQVLPKEIVDALHLEDFGSVHRVAMDADLTKVPAKNITTSTNALGGVTTTYLVPTPDLPMLRPLKGLGVPQPVIDGLEKVLRPIIDSAYVRNDPPSLGSSPRADTPAVDAAAGTAGPPSASAVRTAGTARVSGSKSAAAKPETKALAAKPAAAGSAPTASNSNPNANTNSGSKAGGGVGRSGRSG